MFVLTIDQQKSTSRGDLVPDEMARTFVLCGTPGEVAAQVEQLWAVADSLCLQPPPVPGEQRRAYDQLIAETFYG